MKYFKTKYVCVDSDGCITICDRLKLKFNNSYLIKEKSYKTVKNLKFNKIEKNLKSKYRKFFLSN